MNDLEKLTKVIRERQKGWTDGLKWITEGGSQLVFPENTLLGVRASTRHWGIEADIQTTSDGKWILMNDTTVDRTTNGTGTVVSKSLAQIRALRIDVGENISMMSDTDKIVPTLEEYLAICKQMGRTPVMEIKPRTYTASNYLLLKETLNQYGYDESNCIISSSDYSVLTQIRKTYPNMELHYLVSSVGSNTLEQLKTLDVPVTCSVTYNHATVTVSNVKLIHSSGFKVGVWSVPEASFQDMINLGVDYIMTSSMSGDLRWSALETDNGFTHNSSGGFIRTPFVEEISHGVVQVSFNVSGGPNTKQARILKLPDWATPLYTIWRSCNVRTSAGSDFATVDVYGKTLAADKQGIVVGLNWDKRTTWVTGSFTYELF